MDDLPNSEEKKEEPTDQASKMDAQQPPLESELKRNAKLLESWYQNYYLWNSTFMLNYMMSKQESMSALNQPVVNPSLTRSSTQTLFFPTTEAFLNHLNQNRFPGGDQRVVNVRERGDQVNAHLRFYKIPSLYRRFFAELVDAFYIQILKIIIAIALFNYTDML